MGSPLVLVTRPDGVRDPFTQRLLEKGYAPLCAPMLHIHYPADIRAVIQAAFTMAPDAVLVTSRHALPALLQAPLTQLPLYCVGAAMAERAAAAGYTGSVWHAEDVEGLVRHLSSMEPRKRMVYLRGRDIRADLSTALARHDVCECIVYAAEAETRLPEPARMALSARQLTVATFFSARTADIFLTLAEGLDLSGCMAIGLSSSVCDSLRRGGWRRVIACDSPTANSMLAAVDKACASL